MPRGDNPNSRKNLIRNADLSPKERSERAKKAGIASGVARGSLKSFRELDAETTTPEERQQMLDALKLKAKRGNLRAFEIYRDTIGEKPENKVNVNGKVENPFEGLTTEELKKLVDADG